MSLSLLAIIGWGAGNGSLTMFIQTKWNEHTHIYRKWQRHCIAFVSIILRTIHFHTLWLHWRNLCERDREREKGGKENKRRRIWSETFCILIIRWRETLQANKEASKKKVSLWGWTRTRIGDDADRARILDIRAPSSLLLWSVSSLPYTFQACAETCIWI